MKGWFPKITSGFAIFTALSGCATLPPGAPPPVPTPLLPDAAPDQFQTLKSIQDGMVELGAGPYLTVLKATLNDHVIFVHVLFSNQSKTSLSFGPENLSLTDATHLLVHPLSPSDISQPYVNRAQTLEEQTQEAFAQEQAANQQMADYNAQQDAANAERQENGETETKLETVSDALQGVSVSLTALGADVTANRTAGEAQAAQLAAQTFTSRAGDRALISGEVPSGNKVEGLVYFAEPAQWPATLTLLANGKTLAVRFTPSLSRAEPPQVATSRVDYLTGKSSADFRTLAADLRRSVYIHGIFLEAIPLTPALLSAREERKNFKHGMNPKEVPENASTAITALDPERSQFEVLLGAYDPTLINAADWRATLIDAHQKEYPMSLVQMEGVPGSSYVTAYYRNRLIGSAPKIDWSQPFQLNLERNGDPEENIWDVAWKPVEESTASISVPQLPQQPLNR